MIKKINYLYLSSLLLLICSCQKELKTPRYSIDFNNDWKFILSNDSIFSKPEINDTDWRSLSLPHDWSIEGEFSEKNPAGIGGGALPGGIGWYRKSFTIPAEDKGKLFFIDFDGVYMNSEVWINGNYLGKRPFGYISFRYELTPYLNYGDSSNVIAVKVDNSVQPNSRWYSGSGIYRNVWLVKTENVFVDFNGSYITTPVVTNENAAISLKTTIKNQSGKEQSIIVKTNIVNPKGETVTTNEIKVSIGTNTNYEVAQNFNINTPSLWSIKTPQLYTAVSEILVDDKISDRYETTFGIRYFEFDVKKGFSLNGLPTKIKGVCNHHDLGCLGAAINTRALERQLEILKNMGCNGIRTSHNPPAPELLDLCDKMGFIVMDETFDMWAKKKSDFDYSLSWEEWHVRDLKDHIIRDRNHPSVFVWSIGNEIPEQWSKDSSGVNLTIELVNIVKSLDTTRPVTTANNEKNTFNSLIRSGALDMIGYNYGHEEFATFHERYPGKKFIVTESTSALMTRGSYDMPSDSVRIWPVRWDIPFYDGNKDNSCSSYDNCRAPWGSTHEDTWKVVKKYDHISGMYIWTGFDYIGEPTPYLWPSRSSYFGIIDLAGFPKDVYYMYQSEWTSKPVLHIFPHWNWKEGQTIDIWSYYNNADEVELFLNGTSLGSRKKVGDDLHVVWKIPFKAGELKVISRLKGKEVLTKTINTAGTPSKILLEADRSTINADGKDLSFITLKVLDNKGNLVPNADNLINFSIEGDAEIVGVDNGSQTSMESFKANSRKAFNGLCLAVIKSKNKSGTIKFKASSEGLEDAELVIVSK